MSRDIRLGLLRLADSAPAVMAEAEGLFAAEGLRVTLCIEPSWANIADKLSYGALDAAVILPPLAIAIAAGLRGARRRLVLPMSLSSGGNALTVTTALAGHARRSPISRRPASPWCTAIPPTTCCCAIGWRRAASTPTATWRSSPCRPRPRPMPWRLAPSTVSVPAPQGARLIGTTEIWQAHPEKALAVDAGLAEAEPDMLRALLRALLRAGLLCDDPAGDARLVARLAATDGLGLPEAATRAALRGPDRPVFAAGATNFPSLSHADWFGAQMRRWGWLEAELLGLYRPDLYAQAASELGLPVLQAAATPEGTNRPP
jgi:ABC-type nitrate/sulfonate/bicarbonate transport system substrate-binding protein